MLNESSQSCDHDDIFSRGNRFVFTSIFSVCAVVGVPGNILILIVYHKDRTRLWPAIYVQALAMVDLVVCGVVVPYTVAFEWGKVTQDAACRVLELSRHTLVILSAFILSAVAVERYLAVFQPVKVRTVQKAKKVLAGIAAGSLAFAFPCVFTFSVGEEEDGRPRQNASDVTLRMTSEHEASRHCRFNMQIIGVVGTRAYHVTLVSQHVVCVSLMIFLYVKVYLAIWRRERRKMKVRPEVQKTGSARTEKELPALRNTPNCVPLPAVSPTGKLHAAGTEKGAMLQLHAVSLVSDHPGLSNREQGKEPLRVDGPTSLTTPVEKKSPDVGNQSTQNQRKMTTEQEATPRQHACRNDPDHYHHDNSVIKDSRNNNPHFVTTSSNTNSNPASSCTPPDVPRRRDRWRKAGTMMAACTLIHIVLWLPFWIDLFNITQSLILRYTFLFSHATNPIVYGVFNSRIRKGLKKVLSCK